MKPGELRRRYGSTALVVGASEGLGAAWAEALAEHGLDLVLIARRPQVLEAFAAELRRQHPQLTVDALVGDLRHPDWLRHGAQAGVGGREIDVVIANAAVSPVGPFVTTDPDALEATVEVNALGTLRLARALLPPMAERRRGAFVIMSSLAGHQGSPNLAAYAATKAYLNTLGEGLWAELRPFGVDVLACSAGAVATPGYAAAALNRAPGTLEPAAVVEAALAALGRVPRVIPGATNKLATAVMTRVLSRKAAISIMSTANARLSRRP